MLFYQLDNFMNVLINTLHWRDLNNLINSLLNNRSGIAGHFRYVNGMRRKRHMRRQF